LKLIDLKQNICLAPDYVRLRNEHSEALLTERVGIAQTEAWLAEDCVEVRCLVEGKELLGAAVLYLNKKGEIAFFSKRPGEGAGTVLLQAALEAARDRNIGSVWAWTPTSNIPAQKAFLKCGFKNCGELSRSHNEKVHRGFIFRRDI